MSYRCLRALTHRILPPHKNTAVMGGAKSEMNLCPNLAYRASIHRGFPELPRFCLSPTMDLDRGELGGC